MNKQNYIYDAFVENVVDADTIDVIIDLGLGVFVKERLRFRDIDAWEVRGIERPDGLLAKDYIIKTLLNKNVVIETFKDKKGKYGRYIATIWLGDTNINKELVHLGHAEFKEY